MAFSLSAQVQWDGHSTRDIPYGDQLSVTQRMSETCDWTYSARDDDRFLDPEGNSDWAGYMDDRAYASDGLTYAKRLVVGGTLDGISWGLPHGIPDDYGYALEMGDPDSQFSWKGKGIASKLYEDHLSLPSLISTASNKYHVQDVLASIFTAYGIQYDVSAVEPNYVVPRMIMNDGQPISWVKALLEPTQGAWYEDGGRIVCFQPAYTGTAYDRAYDTAGGVVRRLQCQRSATKVVNCLTVQRADDVGAVLAQADGKTFGRSTVTLSTPVSLDSLHWVRRSVVGGEVSDFWIYDNPPPSLPIAARECRGTPPTTIGGTTARSVSFTFGALSGAPPSSSGSYSLQFRGDATGGVYEDTVTSLVRQDDFSINSGIGKKVDALGPNPLICDQTTMQVWGDRTLVTRARRPYRTSWLIPFDPWLRPGMRVSLLDHHRNWQSTDPAARYTVTRYLVVEQVTHSIVPEPYQRTTAFQAVEYAY